MTFSVRIRSFFSHGLHGFADLVPARRITQTITCTDATKSNLKPSVSQCRKIKRSTETGSSQQTISLSDTLDKYYSAAY